MNTAGFFGSLIAGTVGALYLITQGIGYLVITKDEMQEKVHEVSRMNYGFMSHTDYKIDYGKIPKEETVYNHPFFNSMTLVDGGSFGKNDGLADMIILSGLRFGKPTGTFYRPKHYKLMKEEFDEADKLLAKTKERFKKFFEHDHEIYMNNEKY